MKGMTKYAFNGAYDRFSEMVKDSDATYNRQTKMGSPKWCWYMAREWVEWEKVCPGFYAGTFSMADLLGFVPVVSQTASSVSTAANHQSATVAAVLTFDEEEVEPKLALLKI
jgi:hypothetical protein